ncbi:hypothetical protein R1flu_001063 [Riccia fluitans]|uniref:Uncharacterized protein n=1 Tax=Riccia fluitans TaxID=41844 RepID=A0ABD1Y288_9MARC
MQQEHHLASRRRSGAAVDTLPPGSSAMVDDLPSGSNARMGENLAVNEDLENRKRRELYSNSSVYSKIWRRRGLSSKSWVYGAEFEENSGRLFPVEVRHQQLEQVDGESGIPIIDVVRSLKI